MTPMKIYEAGGYFHHDDDYDSDGRFKDTQCFHCSDNFASNGLHVAEIPGIIGEQEFCSEKCMKEAIKENN